MANSVDLPLRNPNRNAIIQIGGDIFYIFTFEMLW